MYFELYDIFLLMLICLGFYYWVNSQKIREIALKAARAECKKMELQLLDGSVSLKSMKPVRSEQGYFVLQRQYQFEFSATGEERYQGKISLKANRVTSIHMQPHRIVH